MSRKVYRTNLGEHAQDVPLVFANEPRPVVGKGGKAFKSLTAAVKAAEAARDEAVFNLEACRGYKVATEEVLEAACKRLREAEGFRHGARVWCIISALLLLLDAVVCAGYLVGLFF